MAITFVKRTPTPKGKLKRSGGVKPRAPEIDLNQPGLLRVSHLMALFSIRTSTTFYNRLKSGKLPAADGHDGRLFWYTKTVRPRLGEVK